MLTENETTLINNLASAVGKSAEFVTEQYASWLFAGAIGWLCFGLIICASAMRIKFDEDTEFATWAQWLMKSAVVFIGALFVFLAIPDIASPKAAAIHQIIKDVRTVK